MIKHGTNCGELGGESKVVIAKDVLAFDVNGEQAQIVLYNPTYNGSVEGVDHCKSEAESMLKGIERFPSSYKTYYKGTYCFEYNASKEGHSFTIFNSDTANSDTPGFYATYTPSKSDTKSSGQRYSTTSSNIEDWASDFEFYGVVE